MGHFVNHQQIKEVWGHLIMKASNSVNNKQQVQALLISWLMLWELMSCHKVLIFLIFFFDFGACLGSFVLIFKVDSNMFQNQKFYKFSIWPLFRWIRTGFNHQKWSSNKNFHVWKSLGAWAAYWVLQHWEILAFCLAKEIACQ